MTISELRHILENYNNNAEVKVAYLAKYEDKKLWELAKIKQVYCDQKQYTYFNSDAKDVIIILDMED